MFGGNRVSVLLPYFAMYMKPHFAVAKTEFFVASLKTAAIQEHFQQNLNRIAKHPHLSKLLNSSHSHSHGSSSRFETICHVQFPFGLKDIDISICITGNFCTWYAYAADATACIRERF